MKHLTYNELKEQIDNLPLSQYPGIIHHVLKTAARKPVFDGPSGMRHFIDRVLDEVWDDSVNKPERKE